MRCAVINWWWSWEILVCNLETFILLLGFWNFIFVWFCVLFCYLYWNDSLSIGWKIHLVVDIILIYHNIGPLILLLFISTSTWKCILKLLPYLDNASSHINILFWIWNIKENCLFIIYRFIFYWHKLINKIVWYIFIVIQSNFVKLNISVFVSKY